MLQLNGPFRIFIMSFSLEQMLEQYPFLSYIKYPTADFIGIIQNYDGDILSMYAFNKLKTEEDKRGFLEAAEAPEEAIARETHEELGLTAQTVTFVGHYPFQKMNQIIIAYVVEATGEIGLGDEIAEIKLLTQEELIAFDFGPLKLPTAIVRSWFASSQSAR